MDWTFIRLSGFHSVQILNNMARCSLKGLHLVAVENRTDFYNVS